MYAVSEEYKSQILTDRIYKIRGRITPYGQMSIELNSNALCGEITRYSQCVESSESFGIGATYQSELNFALQGFEEKNIYQAKVELEVGVVLDDGTTEWIPLGVYYAEEIEKSGNILNIKALDVMSKLDAKTGMIKGQSTLFSAVMSEITDELGVEFAQTIDEIEELTTLQLSVTYIFNAPETYRDIVRWVAQLIGGFAYINRDGKLEFKKLDNTTPVAEIPADRRHNLQISSRKFEFGKLQYTTSQGYSITHTQNGNGATIYFENNGMMMDSNQSTDGNSYENPWVTDTVLPAIANNLKNISYHSGTLDYAGDPSFDIGDYVRVIGGNADGELMLIGSDNWTFRGVQTIIAPDRESSTSSGYGKGKDGADGINGTNGKDGISPTIEVVEDSDTSYKLKITDKNGSFETPNLKGSPTLQYLQCYDYTGFSDDGLTVAVVLFDVNSSSTHVQLSGDVVIKTDIKSNVEVQYFLDDIALDFFPKLSADGYSTLHLNHLFEVAKGSHSITVKATGKAFIEQSETCIMGYDITLLPYSESVDDYIYTIDESEVTLERYIGTSKRILVPNSVEDTAVTTIASTCFAYSDVVEVVIPDTVTSIY